MIKYVKYVKYSSLRETVSTRKSVKEEFSISHSEICFVFFNTLCTLYYTIQKIGLLYTNEAENKTEATTRASVDVIAAAAPTYTLHLPGQTHWYWPERKLYSQQSSSS